MKLNYTEFSFGYAFTENLIRSTSTGAGDAPVFPNLIQEARVGYDVHINLPGFPLYLQYKLPDLMVRDTATEISRYNLPYCYLPYFRMYLMKRNQSNQHAALIELEKRFPKSVYYVSPCMYNINEFNEAYLTANVHCRSVFFSPISIGPLPDNRQHVVVYRSEQYQDDAWLFSEPRKIYFSQFKHIAGEVTNSFEDTRYMTLSELARNLRDKMLPMVSSKIRDRESEIRKHIREKRRSSGQVEIHSPTEEVIEDILISREIARVGLGLDLIIAQPLI